MKKIVAGVVLGMAMFGGVGSMYMANTGCHKGNACQELIKKACKGADKNLNRKRLCNLWKERVNKGMSNETCETNLKNMK